MTFYTLRAAANRLGLSHETVRKRLQALQAQGLELPTLKLDNRQEMQIIPDELLSRLRQRQSKQTEAAS